MAGQLIAKLRLERLSGKNKPKENDARSPGQIDRDRVLYCTAFRRLAEVTQIVQAAEGHQFHNRLTHVLKVAQIGRRIAERLLRLHRRRRKRIESLGGLDADVVETAGLAHDLGHPPFGHIAEEELLALARNSIQTEEGFEGNAQSFRIITKLAVRTSKEGLDLTRATLNAVLKYPWRKHQQGYRAKKWGVYKTEESEFKEARKAALHKNSRTLEASLMDWADDVAYSVYDLDDFYRAGLIPLDRLIELSPRHIERLFENIQARWTRLEKDTSRLPDHQKQFVQLLEGLSNVSTPLKDPYTGTHAQRAALRNVTSYLVHRYVGAIDLADPSRLPAPRREDGLILGPDLVQIIPEMKLEVAVLQELAWAYVIENPSLAAQQEGQREIIRLLFDRFCKAAHERQWHIFPASMRIDLNESKVDWPNEPVLRTRVVIDLISSMTEVQAVEMYRRLTGHSTHSVTQRIIA